MKFYRYEIVRFGMVSLREFYLYKETPKGYWITHKTPEFVQDHRELYGYEIAKDLIRWVSNDGKKRYAYPSKEQAMLNFTKRTEKRIQIYQSIIDKCEEALRVVKEYQVS